MFFNIKCLIVFLVYIIGKELSKHDTNEVVRNQYLIIVESESGSGSEESLDERINIFLKEYSYLEKKQLFTIDDLKKAFCLDLQIDEKYKDSIFTYIKNVCFKHKSFFGIFLLNRCIQTLLDEKKINELLMDEDVIDEGISLRINELHGLTELDVKRLKIIFNEMCCYTINRSDTTLDFGNIQIDLKTKLYSSIEHFMIDDLINYLKKGLPRMFLSFLVANRLFSYSQGFEILRNLYVQANISSENFYINEDLVNRVCGYLNLLDFETFVSNFFADYYDMVTKTFNIEIANLELRSDELQTSSQ